VNRSSPLTRVSVYINPNPVNTYTLPTTRLQASREKKVITYEHLKGDKTIGTRLGTVEDYEYLKGTIHRDDEDMLLYKTVRYTYLRGLWKLWVTEL